MEKKVRKKEQGYLFVVGGPGGSGATVISKMLANHFNLKRVYAGALFREAVLKKGYKNFEDFYVSSNEVALLKMDRDVDRRIIEECQKKDVLIDSKIFSGVAHIKGIPCTVKIWLDASLHTRTSRHLNKKDTEGFFDRVDVYLKTRKNLKKRWELDRKRYKELYGLDYSQPALYNDIIIDSSKLNEEETFNLVLRELKDGQYIEKK